MKILALDSTALTASVALCEDQTLLAEYTVENGNTHSQTLLPMVESILSMFELTTDEIDLFAASAGPGSFTGVRIGAATVKGLAFDTQKPCLGVSTLEALAENLSMMNGLVCPVMNARRKQVYTALFRFENGAQLIFETSWSFNGPINNSTQIAGEKAGITLEPFKLYRADGEKLITEDIEGDFKGDIFANEIDHFIDCIRNDKTPSSNIIQAVQLQRMLMGIYESSRAGHEIVFHD